MGVGQGKFYLPEAGLQRPAPQEAQTLLGDLGGVFKSRRFEQEGGDHRALGLRFKEPFEVILAGPEVVLELAQKAVKQGSRGVTEVDPIMGERDAQGLADGFKM